MNQFLFKMIKWDQQAPEILQSHLYRSSETYVFGFVFNTL